MLYKTAFRYRQRQERVHKDWYGVRHHFTKLGVRVTQRSYLSAESCKSAHAKTPRQSNNVIDPFTNIAFPGNIIPASRINPVAKAILPFYPDINFGATDRRSNSNFRRNVDKVHEWIQEADGRVASQVFTPHTVGDDGVTMSLWRNDAAMNERMYRPGLHRSLVERHMRERMADRTSFTRFRVLATRGQWGGRDPWVAARG